MAFLVGNNRLFFSLFALTSSQSAASAANYAISSCRSNATHLVWMTPKSLSPSSAERNLRSTESALSPLTSTTTTTTTTEQCQVQSLEDARAECLDFLRQNVMSFDLPFLETLGFPQGDGSDNADGLGNGLIQPTIDLALQAKATYKWTDDLSKEDFLEYVLNYANLNEARTNWRPLIFDALKFNESELWLSGEANLTSVVTWVNQNLWTRLGRSGHPIVFRSSQTPLIFDPMSTIAFGYASCTGTSILFANALRAVGIPARVAGTPAWYGNRTQGNHNWVEVLTESGEWKFLEPSPNSPPDNVDTLDKKPCDRWFCQSSRYPSSRVYAARLLKHAGSEDATFFPLAWEWNNQDVPAVDRTQYYVDMCSKCQE